MAAKPLPSPPMGTSAKLGGDQPRRLVQLWGRGPPNICVLRFTRFPRSARSGLVLPPVLLEAFSAFSAFSAFRSVLERYPRSARSPSLRG